MHGSMAAKFLLNESESHASRIYAKINGNEFGQRSRNFLNYELEAY